MFGAALTYVVELTCITRPRYSRRQGIPTSPPVSRMPAHCDSSLLIDFFDVVSHTGDASSATSQAVWLVSSALAMESRRIPESAAGSATSSSYTYCPPTYEDSMLNACSSSTPRPRGRDPILVASTSTMSAAHPHGWSVARDIPMAHAGVPCAWREGGVIREGSSATASLIKAAASGPPI